MKKSIILLLALILISPIMIRAYTDSNPNTTQNDKIEEVYYAEASAYIEDPFSEVTNPNTAATTVFGTILGVVLISALIIIPKKFMN